MALDEDDVCEIARYATIALDEEELAPMTAYLNDAIAMLDPILGYAAQEVEPTFHPVGDLSNVVRADVVDDVRALSRDIALANAASTQDGQFLIPSILGGGEG